jgi:hypothetical protein
MRLALAKEKIFLLTSESTTTELEIDTSTSELVNILW